MILHAHYFKVDQDGKGKCSCGEERQFLVVDWDRIVPGRVFKNNKPRIKLNVVFKGK